MALYINAKNLKAWEVNKYINYIVNAENVLNNSVNSNLHREHMHKMSLQTVFNYNQKLLLLR